MSLIACNCNEKGTDPKINCDGAGKCYCKPGIGGNKCNKCKGKAFGFPNCKLKWGEIIGDEIITQFWCPLSGCV